MRQRLGELEKIRAMEYKEFCGNSLYEAASKDWIAGNRKLTGIGISIGICLIKSAPTTNIDKVIKKADECVYAVKGSKVSLGYYLGPARGHRGPLYHNIRLCGPKKPPLPLGRFCQYQLLFLSVPNTAISAAIRFPGHPPWRPQQRHRRHRPGYSWRYGSCRRFYPHRQ